jgi:hypothetical protein
MNTFVRENHFPAAYCVEDLGLEKSDVLAWIGRS